MSILKLFKENGGIKPLIRERQSIAMSVSEYDGFLSPYSEPLKPVISSEVALFLENAASTYHPGQEFSIDVYSDSIPEEKREKYSDGIFYYYEGEYFAALREIKRKAFAALWFTLVGIIALAVMFVLSASDVNALWIECIDIFAWVFLWEAVDQFFIERRAARLKAKRMNALKLAVVRFLPKSALERDGFSAEEKAAENSAENTAERA